MKKIFLSILALILIAFVFLLTRVNKEALDFETTFKMVEGKTLKKEIENEKECYLIFISSSCPGAVDFMPLLKRNCEILEKKKIPFYIIADELYKQNVDNELTGFLKQYHFKEPVFLMDKNVYPKNGGLFYNKKRYDDFVTSILGANHQAPLGYGMYMYFKQGKFVKFNNTIN